MSFFCCCPALVPCVLAGNSVKNKVLYKRDKNKDPTFDEMVPPKSTQNRIILEMSNDAIFGGLSFSFEQDAPPIAKHLFSGINEHDFRLTIMNVNRVLQENIPCAGFVVFYSLCCPFTCGLSAIPLWKAGGNAERKIREYIDEQNRTVYAKSNVTWYLHVRNDNTDNPCSWIEVRLNEEIPQEIHD
jgi:hypothetical protein